MLSLYFYTLKVGVDLRNNSLHHFIVHRNLKFDLYKVVLSI